MTYEECFDSPQFLIYFQDQLNKAKIIRLPNPVYRKLLAEGLLVPEWMCNEFSLIQRKLSDRPVRDREWIDSFVRSVCVRTVMFYEKQKVK